MTYLSAVFIKYAKSLIIRSSDWLRMVTWVIRVRKLADMQDSVSMKTEQMIKNISSDRNIGSK